jgi:hypothetical protein
MLKMSLILIDSPKKIGRARSANPATAIKRDAKREPFTCADWVNSHTPQRILDYVMCTSTGSTFVPFYIFYWPEREISSRLTTNAVSAPARPSFFVVL